MERGSSLSLNVSQCARLSSEAAYWAVGSLLVKSPIGFCGGAFVGVAMQLSNRVVRFLDSKFQCSRSDKVSMIGWLFRVILGYAISAGVFQMGGISFPLRDFVWLLAGAMASALALKAIFTRVLRIFPDQREIIEIENLELP